MSNVAAQKIADEVVKALRKANLDKPESERMLNDIVATMQEAIIAAGGTGSADQLAAALWAARVLVLNFGVLAVKHAEQVDEGGRVVRTNPPCSFEDIQAEIKRLLCAGAAN